MSIDPKIVGTLFTLYGKDTFMREAIRQYGCDDTLEVVAETHKNGWQYPFFYAAASLDQDGVDVRKLFAQWADVSAEGEK